VSINRIHTGEKCQKYRIDIIDRFTNLALFFFLFFFTSISQDLNCLVSLHRIFTIKTQTPFLHQMREIFTHYNVEKP